MSGLFIGLYPIAQKDHTRGPAAAQGIAKFFERGIIPFAMDRKFIPLPPDLVQTHPGLGILRLAALLAKEDGDLDEDALDAMFEQVEV